MMLMVCGKGRAKELADMLQKELGIPAHVRWFTVRFGLDGCVTVTCEYAAEEKQAGVEFTSISTGAKSTITFP